jgi:PKHD-type hydroxylase
MTEENIIRELYMKFDEENNPEEEEEVNPNEPNMVLSTSEDEDEDSEDQIKTEEDNVVEDEEEYLTDDEINFVREFYDEDGNEKEIREHLVGDHKIAHSPIYFEDVLPDYLMDFIERRIDEIEEEDWESGETGNEVVGGENPESRRCEISWIPEIDWVSTIFTHYFHIANREIWEYDLTELESIQVTKYDKNHFYGWHSDYGTSADKSLTRKLSMSIILSDPEDYSGGKLQFIDYMGKVQNVTKERGTVVVFDSRTPHRVTPILRGRRLSLVAWFTGPKLR